MGDHLLSTSQTVHCPNKTHHLWNNSLNPILTINSGDTVIYNFRDISDSQIHPEATVDVFDTFDDHRLFPLVGPVYVEDAQPGDTLEIEVVDLHTKGWGWTAIRPGKGLLAEEFDEHDLRIFDLSNGDFIPFNEHIHIPIEPFLGTMGVAPFEEGDHQVGTPGVYGGDMDIRHLTKGSRLLLPVHVPGALFSAGDGHAAQGDGEVCMTAVECPLYGVLRFKVHKDKKIEGPQLITSPGSLRSRTDEKGFYVTTGVGPDLMECSRNAIRSMIEYLFREHLLTRNEAYMLCSLTVDLKISALVNKPNYIVSAYLPLSIFK